FPLDQLACNEYFLLSSPFYLSIRTGELSVPLISSLVLGPAFPSLYPIALLSVLVGYLQDRWNFLRRLKPLAPLYGTPLSELWLRWLCLAGVVAPFAFLTLTSTQRSRERRLHDDPRDYMYLPKLPLSTRLLKMGTLGGVMDSELVQGEAASVLASAE
ncbi:MAG: hypothetical protein SGPRY_015015, partial [Prymnesium sp.]